MSVNFPFTRSKRRAPTPTSGYVHDEPRDLWRVSRLIATVSEG